ncbi:MAG: hypothetical protein FWF81_00060 [Defluviitaleaceae bacterium]|nr:hypothetical protein [Defluviitaleaceae bacterium]
MPRLLADILSACVQYAIFVNILKVGTNPKEALVFVVMASTAIFMSYHYISEFAFFGVAANAILVVIMAN